MTTAVELSPSLVKGSIKYFELLSAIVGTIYFYKFKRTHLKYFLFLLWYIVLTEFIGDYFYENKILTYIDENGLKYNLWVVNLLYSIFFPVIYYIYLKSIKNPRHILWIKSFFIIFIFTSIINWLFIQSFIKEWSELPFIVGSLLLVFSIIFYFIEILKSEKVITFHRILLFWISVGLLLFHTGSIPFVIKINGYALIPGIHKLFLIVYILAIMMYLIFTFGFIWSKKEQQ